MISFDEALERVCAIAGPLSSETVASTNPQGLTLANQYDKPAPTIATSARTVR